MPFDDVRALVFDVFGTVVDWRTGVAREAEAFLQRHGRDDIDPFDFADKWRGLYLPSMMEVGSGRRPFVPLDVLHRENLEAVLSGFGVDPQSIRSDALTDLNFAWHRLDPWPDAVEGLHRLKRKFIIATLSNGNIALLLNMAKRAGLPWDAILGAEVSRAYKPMPEAYLRTAEVLGLAPGQVCLVAAHNGDLAAAAACGLRTAFVARPDEYGPGQGKGAAPTGPWDAVAADLIDLAAQLKCA